MEKLPDGYREAVILHDIEGLGHKEIAEMKGRSDGTSSIHVLKLDDAEHNSLVLLKHRPDPNELCAAHFFVIRSVP